MWQRYCCRPGTALICLKLRRGRSGRDDAWHSTKRPIIHPANFHNLFTTSAEHAGA